MNNNFMQILNTNLTDEEAREYISMMFDGYEKRKKEKRLFTSSDKIPMLIILTYYGFVKKPNFDSVVENFKKRYIYNESKMEEVHTNEEKNGLGLVYSYIQTKEDLNDINLYTLSDIHKILYSKSPYPEFGGTYRRDEVFLPTTGVDLTEPCYIVHEMNALRDEIDEIVKEGLELGKTNDIQKLIPYIDKCVELKCKLIKIHPFKDGNGRSIRAFINLLFRLANIPPIYIENKEKTPYHQAMNKAMGEEHNLEDIKGFYYYKICDSIIQLDLALKKQEGFIDEAGKEKEVIKKKDEIK